MSASLSPARPRACSSVSFRIDTTVLRWMSALGREWRLRRALAAIAEMGPRELADIGLGPGGAEDAVRGGRRWTRGGQEAAPLRQDRQDRPDRPDRPTMPSRWTEWR